MASILWVDSLGKRYGMLPSEVIGKANTFDLYVMDAAMAFENFHHKIIRPQYQKTFFPALQLQKPFNPRQV